MTISKPLISDDALAEKVIDELYEVAVDPTRYEALLDHWERLIAPHRGAANAGRLPEIPLPEFESHFQRADRVLRDVTLPVSEMTPEQVMTRIERTAALAIDASGKIAQTNPVAASVFGLGPGAALSALPLAEGEAEVLFKAVLRALRSNSTENFVLRLRGAVRDRTMLFSLRRLAPRGEEPFVLAITSELGWPPGFERLLSEAFDLTSAEAQIVHGLSDGSSVTEIAQQRDRSVETIRAQVKSIMAKTGTRSQPELVRLTLSTMEMAQYSGSLTGMLDDHSIGFGTLEDRPFRTMHHVDGRRQDYLILGDETGQPCLYLPLDYGLVRWPASAEAEAARRGLKIIVPVRAGFGHSTPLPRNVDYGPQLVDDMAALLDHLGHGRVPVITLGGDSFLAFLLNERHPDRVAAILCAAGVLPNESHEQYERMEKWHRFILAGARYTPHVLPFLVKAGFALANRMGKRAFVHAVYGNSAADRSTFEIPEVYEAMVCGSEVCLSDGHSAHDAFSREVIAHETIDWTGTLTLMREATLRKTDPVPVIFFNGLQDPQVHPDTLAEHRENYPWIDFRVFPDAGQLLFFLKWRDILDALTPIIRQKR
ncbi:helix-turn-helix transcriptional regulator [Ponticoccus sp. SC2-23]|uniref:LuxR C-terminal-related transcriptional regulator n=1 Tax=Alexandriicola marinus TaxID=2081710 RepID=UPI000FD817AC|nr:LuxR C-terminal-related transcriptional regulator [Alexandriicola marinus]MBM1219474.1 helix-turn-helix transcriptional regulator [Ponticoccus sp. SC6-9]MBM1223454.1 helix-turn-helix transcriptional regulator [Ponticoccus sp. SC6-15]MBM1229287.1 helix-turn-helix transcriptional regulator [Ponticoccus sp. SC6-38]MBM1232420.1 helix-turn-helix transcriptional regulator [Ponticoccus sp. SC6-45]MBM1237630.1 helix-turn-helix transcriptional regulator [Ponticoccus sp. SC6-49]MBM1241431.1 helix-tu